VPGIGGIPYDFFKEYADIGPPGFDLVEGIRAVMSILIQPTTYNVSIPEKWSTGIIKLLYKKGDKTDTRNYRPLSMTKSIYKLFTTIINNRLLTPFSLCIGEHQVGFMPGRSYFDHVKHAQVLIDYARMKNERLFIVLLDQEKAYDRIDHGYLWKALEKFGVPTDIIRAIQGCYAKAKSVVSVNKFTSEPFDVNSGVRQGDPLLCLLFNAVIETLALRILKEK
jgi:hypothetical protein